jgi:hypothetical protein
MKTTHIALLVASLAAFANLSAQTITGYGVARYYDVKQTTSGAPVASSANPYMISGYVFGSGLSGTYEITFSGGSVTSPVAMTYDSNGAEFQSSGYPDLTALNAAYGSGSFGMNISTGAGLLTPSLLSLPAGGFPELPQITNGSWIANQMQIDATQNYTINFAAFSSFSSDDSYMLQIRDGSDATVASGSWNTAGTTSFLVNAGTLTVGQTYYASLQFNNNHIDYAVPNLGNGNVGYSVINEFEILAVGAIPEPSTYAAIFGVVALVGVMLRRRRQAA